MEKIKVDFTEEYNKPSLDTNEREKWLKIINTMLDTIKHDVIKLGGFVEHYQHENGEVTIIAHCKDEKVKKKMQKLLNPNR